MLSFILVRKLVLMLCIKSSLIMLLPAPTINKTPLNPITYGILRFRQLRGGEGRGAFWPRSRKQGHGWRIDLKFGTDNGTNDTSKHAKF